MASFYEFFAYIGGLLYLNLYVWIMFPSIFIFLQNFFGGKSKVEDNRDDFCSLLTMVAPIGFIYIYGAYNHLKSLIDLTIVWRLLWVAPWIVISEQTSGLEKSAGLLIASLDVGLPAMAILVNWSEAKGIPGRLLEHFKHPAVSASRKLLLWIGRIGFLLVVILATNLVTNTRQTYVQSFIISVANCYFLFFEWIACTESSSITYFVGFIEMFLILNVLAIMFIFGHYHELQYQILLSYLAVSTFCHFYTVAWDQTVVKRNWSYAWWNFSAKAGNTVISVIWVLFMPLFDELARKKATGKHRQDLIFALFVSLVVSSWLEVISSNIKLRHSYIC